MEAVEVVLRCHLNVHKMREHQPDKDVHSSIVKEALSSELVLSCWETIAKCIPPKLELYSTELLTAVISLWVTIRAHAFARGWTMMFERRYKKGTRKSLKTKITTKDD